MIQAHIFYSGTVQGVGFRYNVQRLATPLNLNGWVKNLNDGRVEILVEGKEESIQQLIAQVDQKFDGFIRNKEIAYGPISGIFRDFQITY